MNAISGHDMYQEGEMCDVEMLDIYIMETTKLLLYAILKHIQRIKESKGRLIVDITLKGIHGC